MPSRADGGSPRIEWIDGAPSHADAASGAPPRFAMAGRRARMRRPLAVTVAVVATSVALAAIALTRPAGREPRSAAARHRWQVALVSTWIASSAASTVNLITSGGFGECPDVNPRRPPQDRILRELRDALPRFRARSTIRSIDQFGQLCMVEVSVRRADGAIAVLRVEPPHELALVACCRQPQAVTVSRRRGATGYVAGTPGHSGWTVALGWADPRGRLNAASLVGVVRAESRHW